MFLCVSQSRFMPPVFILNDFKVAHSSFFFCLEVRLLNTKFLSEGNLRFLPYYTIIVTYDERCIFHWFPSNRGYHSNNTGILLSLNKTDFLEI